MKKLIILTALCCLVFGCVENTKLPDKTKHNSETNKSAKTIEEVRTEKLQKTKSSHFNSNEECLNVDVGNKVILENLTFSFNFKPFENSCFVSAYDSEFSNPPTSIELALYKDGVKIYTFESRFNTESVNCTVKEISFEDLNKDNLQDVIVAGKCGTKSVDLIANEVFMNTGKKTFYTETSSNDKLDNLKNIKEITDFVKKNKDIYFK